MRNKFNYQVRKDFLFPSLPLTFAMIGWLQISIKLYPMLVLYHFFYPPTHTLTHILTWDNSEVPSSQLAPDPKSGLEIILNHKKLPQSPPWRHSTVSNILFLFLPTRACPLDLDSNGSYSAAFPRASLKLEPVHGITYRYNPPPTPTFLRYHSLPSPLSCDSN